MSWGDSGIVGILAVHLHADAFPAGASGTQYMDKYYNRISDQKL